MQTTNKMTKSQAIKHLQCLFAWAEFYGVNEREEDWNKTQLQIDEHKKRYDLCEEKKK